jgi:hypothetical protein
VWFCPEVWAEAAVTLAAVNKAVAAATIVAFEFIAKRSMFQSRKGHPPPSTFKSYILQRFDCVERVSAGGARVEWNFKPVSSYGLSELSLCYVKYLDLSPAISGSRKHYKLNQ